MNMKCHMANCSSQQSKEWKCSKCNLLFCTLICLSKHISTTHNANTAQKESSFLSKGTFLNPHTPSDSYYHFNNFDFVLTSNMQLKCIGSGAFGDLYLAKNKLDNKQFAIKQVNKAKVIETGATLSIIKREIGYHIRLIHPNIVRLYSQHEDTKNFYMIMEYIPKGTLFQEIQKNKRLSEEKAFKYFIQVAAAIHFLHQNGLAHRDIKPENILIDYDGTAKLCDFGWCVDVSKGERATFCGTYEYMAPEIVNDQLYDYSTDVWSLGVLLYEMIHSYSPFRAQRGNDAMTEIFKNIKERKYTIDKPISFECSDIIGKLLTLDTKQRIRINEIFESPWVKAREPKPIEKPITTTTSAVVNNKQEVMNIKPKEASKTIQKESIIVSKPKEEENKEYITTTTAIDNNKELVNTKLKEAPTTIHKESILLNKSKEEATANNHTPLSSSSLLNSQKAPLSSSLFLKESKENKVKFQSNHKQYIIKNEDEFDDIISKVHKANEIKQMKNDKKKEKMTKVFSHLTPTPNNKNNQISLETNDQSNMSLNFNLNKSNISTGPMNRTGFPATKKMNIDDLEISESEEFAFLKDIRHYQGSKKTYDPSKVLNMNFLPKDMLYKEGGYKESAQEILATIDLLDKAQRNHEDGIEYIPKKEKQESAWDKFFKSFQCGQCS